MDLKEILNTDIIDLHVTGTEKREVLENISKQLLEHGYIGEIKQFVDDIFVREAEGPTGMGANLSIPHGKSKTVKKIGIAIGRTVNAIRWESSVDPSGYQDTDLIFLFCVSADASFVENHLLLLSQLAAKLGNDARVRKLRTAKSAQEIIDFLLADDAEIGGTGVNDNEEIVELDINL